MKLGRLGAPFCLEFRGLPREAHALRYGVRRVGFQPTIPAAKTPTFTPAENIPTAKRTFTPLSKPLKRNDFRHSAPIAHISIHRIVPSFHSAAAGQFHATGHKAFSFPGPREIGKRQMLLLKRTAEWRFARL